MNADAFWERVNAALDQRRDPLADPLVQRELEGSPDRFGELERLLRAASKLERAPQPARVRRTAAALIAVAAGAAALLTLRHLQSAADRPTEHVADAAQASTGAADFAPSAPPGFVLQPCIALLELRATFTHRTADEIREVQIDALSDSSSREVHRRAVEGSAIAFSVATIRTSQLQP